MDESQQLKQLISADLLGLGKYYRGMADSQGAGVLVVNYYPIREVAQMEARFLKSSQIPRLSRQMGLPELQTLFEQHDREKEMVLAIVTAETKGAIAVELQLPTSEVSEPEIPSSIAGAEASKAKSKSSATTTTQRQAKKKPNTAATPKPETPEESQSQVSSEPIAQTEDTPQLIVESETTAKSTLKATNQSIDQLTY
ncbi:hypothetical protein C7Y66_09985 [Chroococcidiopsis sp. CCALA 051]|uniref:hypothetical protein n=1 Tax=Chroococcidiopsis sp. CCALA 051 TaxID=869949 RepID=UPI000D0CDE59|nr:hypothetical protein [Chroococcidiopsis sp. CCALA 051]PSM49330.1 hypothetical protein C7Y66_09985 [Chroococcidiopsis sp. CCALA 051]